jgi:hypothetical protein
MIREIETNNTTEYLDVSLQPVDFEHIPDIVTATLSANGMVLTAMVNRYLRNDCVRKVTLNYMLPFSEQQFVMEYVLGTYGPSDTVDELTKYVFSLDPVLHQIVHPAPEQLPDNTVNIRLYTYEANTAFNYGTCYPQYDGAVLYAVGSYVQYGGRLWQALVSTIGNLPTNPQFWNPTGVPSSGTITFNMPFTVSYPGLSIIPRSTDGWYTLRVVDIEKYNNGILYNVNDIVFYPTGFFICTRQTLGNLPTDGHYWTPMTVEQEHNLYEFGYTYSPTLATVLNTDMLITRYIKQKFIYELLVKSNYKRYDNLTVVSQLEKIYAMREAAVVHLNAGNPITARNMLDLITIEDNSFMVNNRENKAIETFTNFTI